MNNSLAAEHFLRDIYALQGKMRMAHRHIDVYQNEIAKTLDNIRRLRVDGYPLQIALFQKRLDAQREWVRTYEYVAHTALEAIMLRKRALYELGWKG